MAVGMAMDLGLGFDATAELAGTEDERDKLRSIWWAVLLIDRINSWGKCLLFATKNLILEGAFFGVLI